MLNFFVHIEDEATFEAVWEAITQYYENQRDYIDSLEDPPEEEIVKLQKAEDVMGKFDAFIARLAE